MLSRRNVEVLLSKLCVDLGFCLPPEEQKRLAERPPANAQAFHGCSVFCRGTRSVNCRSTLVSPGSRNGLGSVSRKTDKGKAVELINEPQRAKQLLEQ
jgi:hypothetical protein